MSEKLDELVSRYGKEDSELKALKSVCDADKEAIKTLMANEADKHYTSGGYTVTYVVQEEDVVDEAKMLSILKHYWTSNKGSMECPYIKTVTLEVLDADALESAIYSEELPKDVIAELGTCNSKKRTVKLMCKKAKEKTE